MSPLEAFHGLIVDQRRYTNVHLRHRQPPEPTDRYELWLQPRRGTERKFTLHTREMPARRGHEVSLIVTRDPVPKVLALANWTTVDGINYARSEPPSLLRLWDLLPVAAIGIGLAIRSAQFRWTPTAMAVALYLLSAVSLRWHHRSALAAEVDKAIESEAWRLSRQG